MYNCKQHNALYTADIEVTTARSMVDSRGWRPNPHIMSDSVDNVMGETYGSVITLNDNG